LEKVTHQPKHRTNSIRDQQYLTISEMPIKLNNSSTPLTLKIEQIIGKSIKTTDNSAKPPFPPEPKGAHRVKRMVKDKREKESARCPYSEGAVVNVGKPKCLCFWREVETAVLSIVYNIFEFRERKRARRTFSRFLSH
jgi:hypothetical protein